MAKYVIQWENRVSPGDEDSPRRLLAVFSKWTPAASNILQSVSRLDNQGGLSIVETDNPNDVLRDVSKFEPWLKFTVYPVIDVTDAVPIFNEGIDFIDSIPK